MKEKIILELIPTAMDPKVGYIVQISAIKVNDINILSRFDVRLKDMKIPEFKEMLSYDDESFTYLETTEMILESFRQYVGDTDLVIIDNKYTEAYLSEFDNSFIYYHDLVGVDNSDTIIDDITTKYNLAPTEHIVDLMFEALIFSFDN